MLALSVLRRYRPSRMVRIAATPFSSSPGFFFMMTNQQRQRQVVPDSHLGSSVLVGSDDGPPPTRTLHFPSASPAEAPLRKEVVEARQSRQRGKPRVMTATASQSSSPHSVTLTSNRPTADTLAAYQRTLSKPLTADSSVDSLSHSTGRTPSRKKGKEGFDPAVVVHLESATRQIHLSPIQKELVWKARRKLYQSTLVRVVSILQSHLAPIERCLLLLRLHEEVVIPERLRMRDDTYADIFHLFFATATLAPSTASGSHKLHTLLACGTPYGSESATNAAELVLQEAVQLASGEITRSTSRLSSVPGEFASRAAANFILTSQETVQQVWQMYRYMVDSGTKPNPRVLQYVMGLLEQSARRLTPRRGQSSSPALTALEAKAHSLMMDADRYRFCPSQHTVHSYIYICQACGVMHLALARVVDVHTRWEQQPSSDAYALLLSGFLRQPENGAEDALRLMTTMQSAPVNHSLLHSMLMVCRSSPDPLSAFAVYRSLFRRRVGSEASHGGGGGEGTRSLGDFTPTLHTFSILLKVILEYNVEGVASAAPARPCGDADMATRRALLPLLQLVVKDMKLWGVRGNPAVMNDLLRAFLRCGCEREYTSLLKRMHQRGMRVFDELSNVKTHHSRKRPKTLPSSTAHGFTPSAIRTS